MPDTTARAGRGTALIVCVALTAAVLLVFGRTAGCEFINFDDPAYFTSNHHVERGLTWEGVGWAFTTGHAGNWHPLTWLSLMLDAEWFGAGPEGPHVTNVLLHAANGILLLLLLKRLTGRLWPAAIVAALFALHPLRVESVAWISERKDVLSAFFGLLTLLAYAGRGSGWNAADTKFSPLPSAGRGRCYVLALVFFALGLMSKPMLVTLPFVLLLLDYWPLDRVSGFSRVSGWGRLAFEKWPFFLMAIAVCMVTVIVQQQAIQPVLELPLLQRIGHAPVVCVNYVVQTIWPANLAAYYPYPMHVPVWQVTGAGILLMGATFGALVAARRMPWVMIGWLWYLGMLMPVIGLVQVGGQSHADRYTYLPQIGLWLALVWSACELTVSWRHRNWILGVGTCAVLVALGLCAWNQTSYWRDSESLWRHALDCTRDNFTAHDNLGRALAGQGRTGEAIEQYQKALSIFPRYTDARNNLGEALVQEGRLEEAARCFHEVIEVDPRFAEAHNNLGLLAARQGRGSEALSFFQRAVELKPDSAEMRNNLGSALAAQGRASEAVAQIEQALQVVPDYTNARFNLAQLLAAQQRPVQAIEQYRLVLKLKPDFTRARYQLGVLLQAQGRYADAIAQFHEIIQLDPGHFAAQNNLAWILATCPESQFRDGPRALALAERVRQFAGNNSPEILDTVAAAYAESGRFAEAIETARSALSLAAQTGNTPLVEALQMRLKLYQSESAYHGSL